MAQLIGWRERAALPELGIKRLKLKIDTGARTSALHAVNIHAFHEANVEWVEFDLGSESNSATKTSTKAPNKKSQRARKPTHCRARVLEHRVVKDSGGHEETRVVIETQIELAGQTWPIELSLTDRASMGYRMLLGRTALAGRFIIDPNDSYLTTQSRRGNGRPGQNRHGEDSREEE